MQRACKDKIEYIDLLIEGGLSEKEASELKAHLANCPGCHVYHNDMKSLKEALLSMDLKAPEGLNESIMAEIRKLPVIKKERKWFRPAYVAAYAAAACIVLIFSIFMFSNGLFIGKNFESAELDNEETANALLNDKADDGGRFELQSEANAVPTAVPEPESDTTVLVYKGSGVTAGILGDEGYMFSKSPFTGPDNTVVNPNGIDLNEKFGLGDYEDLILVTTGYTSEEVVEILFLEFGMKSEITGDGYVRVQLPSDMVSAVTARIDLVAAAAVENDSKSYEVLIIEFSN